MNAISPKTKYLQLVSNFTFLIKDLTKLNGLCAVLRHFKKNFQLLHAVT